MELIALQAYVPSNSLSALRIVQVVLFSLMEILTFFDEHNNLSLNIHTTSIWKKEIY